MKRFWDDAQVNRDIEGEVPGWQVLLDGRPVRVPGAGTLTLPTERLAIAVAAEWREAGGGKGGDMSYEDVPLTRIAGTAQERVAPNPEPVILELAQYAESDLLCYRAAAPPELVRRQAAAWQPWLDWAAQRFGGRLEVTTGVMHIAQPPRALASFATVLAGFEPLALAALGILVPAFGSLVLALAVADNALDVRDAYALATLDEQFQEEIWGEDDQALARRRQIAEDVAVAARILRLLQA